ncbi:hypothetical protein KGF46_19730, partial [Clostridioides sp. ZZV14-6153]|nr:hypothetical protein [Clostridioides sp. ZZV14-6153]
VCEYKRRGEAGAAPVTHIPASVMKSMDEKPVNRAGKRSKYREKQGSCEDDPQPREGATFLCCSCWVWFLRSLVSLLTSCHQMLVGIFKITLPLVELV